MEKNIQELFCVDSETEKENVKKGAKNRGISECKRNLLRNQNVVQKSKKITELENDTDFKEKQVFGVIKHK